MGINNAFGEVLEIHRVTPVQLVLKVSETKITLMETVDLTLSFRRGTFDPNLFTSMQYLIGWKDQIETKNWLLSEQISNQHNNVLIRKAGKWEVQVEAVLASDGSTIVSNKKEIEVRFPHVNEIKSDPIVVTAMNATWEHTKSVASASNRQEFGFWIYYNTNGSGTYICGSQVSGSRITGGIGSHGSVSLGGATLQRPSLEPSTGGVFLISGFHTHTPLSYQTGKGGRPIGPSQTDDDWASNYKLPGIVYDYTGSYHPEMDFTGKSIEIGHNIDSPAMLYTFGIGRKKTPENIFEQ